MFCSECVDHYQSLPFVGPEATKTPLRVCGDCASIKWSYMKRRVDVDQQLLEQELLPPIDLECASHNLTIRTYMSATILDVLREVASKLGLTQQDADMLQLQFSENVVPHEHSVQQVGLCHQARFEVLGVEEVKALRVNS